MPWRLVLKLVEIAAIGHLRHRLCGRGPEYTFTSGNSNNLCASQGGCSVKEFTIGVMEREWHQRKEIEGDKA